MRDVSTAGSFAFALCCKEARVLCSIGLSDSVVAGEDAVRDGAFWSYEDFRS